MALVVQKFGGTSVANVERINAVADKVTMTHSQGDPTVVVVSAMSGETNRLLALAREVNEQPPVREVDMLLATGEQVTIALLAMALARRGISARSYTGGQVNILTDNIHGKARILEIDSARINKDLAAKRVVVVAGFQGVDGEGNITTLGRGGSDTTAVALAAALQADECRIYTDVDGVYTADPRIVPEAQRLQEITVEEMLELSSLGAKVLQTRSVEFAGKYHIPLRVLSSFKDGPGTLISYEETTMERPLISGIAGQKDDAKLTIRGIPDRPGIAYTVLGVIADAGITVDMIIQNIGADGSTDLTFTLDSQDLPLGQEKLDELAAELGATEVLGDEHVAKISVVGVGMRSHSGVASTMFKSLAAEGINIQMISTSEIKISVVVEDKYLELAIRTLHRAFGLDNPADPRQLLP